MDQISLKDPIVRLLLATAAIILVTYFLSQNVILKPLKKQIAAIRPKLDCLKIEEELDSIQKEIDLFEKTIPPRKDPSWLLTQITEIAGQAKLNIKSIEPLPARQIQPYTCVAFKIKTECFFSQLLKFISLTESSQYILNIEDLSLKTKSVYTSEVAKEELSKETPADVEITVGTIY